MNAEGWSAPSGLLQVRSRALSPASAAHGGVLCIYIVLVLLFKDFVQPATILAALVLSIPGAFLALFFITQTAISMPSMIGLIMLMATATKIATRNSILLVEYAIMARRDKGMTRMEALLDACQKRAADPDDGHRDGCRHAADRAGKRALERPILLEHCPTCGGELKIIGAILEQPGIEKILMHLGLQASAPPRAPARGSQLHAA